MQTTKSNNPNSPVHLPRRPDVRVHNKMVQITGCNYRKSFLTGKITDKIYVTRFNIITRPNVCQENKNTARSICTRHTEAANYTINLKKLITEIRSGSKDVRVTQLHATTSARAHNRFLRELYLSSTNSYTIYINARVIKYTKNLKMLFSSRIYKITEEEMLRFSRKKCL